MDLHPEDLIERDAEGTLAPAEQARLEAHLAHCPSCRMERRVRDDFQRIAERADLREQVDPVEPDVRALVASVLRPDRPRARGTARPRFRRRFRLGRLRVALVAAALFTLTGLAAAAANWPVVRGLWNPPVMTPVVQLAASPSPSHHGLAARNAAPSMGVPLEAPAAPLETSPAEEAEGPPVGDLPAAPVTLAHESRMALPSGSRAFATSVAASSVGRLDDASGLFSKASAARRRGDRALATASYQRLVARYPASPEAHESHVAVGRMLLDAGDAAQALQSFEAYARVGGPLVEEALLGEALSLQALGRSEEERKAWTALLDLYPDSVHTERARTRLTALGR